MKLKGEYKVSMEQLKAVPDIKRILCREMLFDMIDKLTTEQMEQMLNLRTYDPRSYLGWDSSDYREAKKLKELREQLYSEQVVLFRGTVNIPVGGLNAFDQLDELAR